jgi:hypothetical protein
MDELEMYNHLILYCGHKSFYITINSKLRKDFGTSSFNETAKPFLDLARLNKKLGFNQLIVAYRGIQFRNTPYTTKERENKYLDVFRNAFPYNNSFPEILDDLIKPGKREIKQLISTTLDMEFALHMSDVEFFKHERNPYVSEKQTHIFLEFNLLKRVEQINVPKLYAYFKKKFSFDDMKIDKDVVDNFLLHVVDQPIDEIIIVPGQSFTIEHVETEEQFLSKSKFTEVKDEILRKYKKSKSKEKIVTNSFFVKIVF